ncbi:MAG: acetolactate synthase small subunit [Solobacterium sp.]|nr:acetolactate synthase small subunit [Solobacterium sp.]MBR2793074.1 acetolactate synthase small subunit [Solobacterium sp.]
MRRIFSVLVENRSGVLSKVSGLFARRSFNIDSLAVGETNDPAVSCMTIVSSGSSETMEQIEKQLNKKLDVIKIKSFESWQSIARELILIKLRYNKSNREEILTICTLAGAHVVDAGKRTMMVEMCDTPEKVQMLLDLLAGISIVEVARTGTLALQRCVDTEH